jgi:hypothetical protein
MKLWRDEKIVPIFGISIPVEFVFELHIVFI